jgi:teichuronic acid biosynthesis glycosyltransferase TuaG
MKNNKEPLVSIVVTTYNRNELLKETINSILSQTYTNFELIVVDNYSNYDFVNHIKSYNDHRIIAFQNKNNGIIAVNRNFGIKKSKGEYIAFCDDDDLWMPLKLEKQIYAFEKNKSAGIVAVGTRIKPTDDTLKFITHSKHDVIIKFEDLFYSKSTALSSIVINTKQLFNENKNFIASEDYEYQIRLLKKTGGKLLILKDDLVIYRITNSNASMDISKYINTLNVIEFYKESLTSKIYFDAMYIANVKIGLKALKLGVPSKDYFMKSLNFTKFSISRYSISLFLLVLSIMPNYVIRLLLVYIYNKKSILNKTYSNLT